MSLLIQQIDNSLAKLAWSLWNELGVAGVNRQHGDCLISLEELIILTTLISEVDPRLRDESLDWCSRYHHFVSISRLRTLLKAFGDPVISSYSQFAATLNSVAQSNWPVITNSIPLNVKISGKSNPPNCKAASLLGLRLRALFGSGGRADLLTFFLTHTKIFTASDMVEIGYSKRSLADLLDFFVQSGILVALTVRNQKTYEFVKREEFEKLIGSLPKYAPPWRKILELLIALRIGIIQNENKSVDTKAVVVSNILTANSKILRELNLSPPSLNLDANQYWILFTSWLLETLNAYSQGIFIGSVEIANNFETTVFSLMQRLYNVDDCLDGLEFIVSLSKENADKHKIVYKEAYKLCIDYMKELEETLTFFLKFPFHQLGDAKLQEIVYQYSHEQLRSFLKFIEEFPSLSGLSNLYCALQRYENLIKELNKLNEFIYKLKEQLKVIYSLRMDVFLLTQAPKLVKRHSVIKLFS